MKRAKGINLVLKNALEHYPLIQLIGFCTNQVLCGQKCLSQSHHTLKKYPHPIILIHCLCHQIGEHHGAKYTTNNRSHTQVFQ